MADRAIDYDRGVEIRVARVEVGKDKFGNSTFRDGVEVYMYIDEPGRYYSAWGTPVSVKLAQQAGYNVAINEQRRRQKVAISELLSRQANAEKLVVKQLGGFKIVQLGPGGRYIVESPDGKNVTPQMSLDIENAEQLLNDLANVEAEMAIEQLDGSPVVVRDTTVRTGRGARAPVGREEGVAELRT